MTFPGLSLSERDLSEAGLSMQTNPLPPESASLEPGVSPQTGGFHEIASPCSFSRADRLHDPGRRLHRIAALNCPTKTRRQNCSAGGKERPDHGRARCATNAA